MGHYQAGRRAEAEAACREILGQEPGNAQALHFMGMLAYEGGNAPLAAEYIARAVAAQPSEPAFLCNLALVQIEGGALEAAEESCRAALRLNPAFADAHNNLGDALMKRGRMEEAAQSFEEATRLNPASAVAHKNLGAALKEMGKPKEAILSYYEAIRLQPAFPEALNNLGNALRELGKMNGAIASFREAIRFESDYPEAHNNLGNALKDMGKPGEAVKSYQEALRLRANYPEAHNNLGGALIDLQKYEAAEEYIREAIRLKPDFADGHFNLGIILHETNDFDGAIASCKEAIRLKPDHALAHAHMGDVYKDLCQIEEAHSCYERAIDILPDNPVLRIAKDTILSPIMKDVEEIDRQRNRLEETILKLKDKTDQINLEAIQIWGKETPWFLSFHGRNDVKIRSDYADLFHESFPKNQPILSDNVPRIGFVVTAKHEPIFLTIMKGIITNFSSDKFKISIICTAQGRDFISPQVNKNNIEFCIIPTDLLKAAEGIWTRKFDVLFFFEVGTDQINYFLPFFRLAPVQCAGIGHANTTGIPEIDYFVSNEIFEPEKGDSHYRETLIRLKGMYCHYTKPELPANPCDRAHFNLSESSHIYACPQSLFKIHPDFDYPLGEILRRDPQGTLVMLEARHPSWKDALMHRFSGTIPDVVERIRFLPRLKKEEFHSLIALSDVMLDPFHYGGGSTSLEGLAFGVPIVTLPGEFMRSRYCLAYYELMGMGDCVASDVNEYSDIACMLGTDRNFRQTISEKILDTNQIIFEDMTVVRELEKFFLWAIDKARNKRS